jgi:hypothetical protein
MKEETENLNCSYYMVIPASVWNDRELTQTQIILYGHISTLANKMGYCFATNETLGKLLNVNKTSASFCVSALEKQGHIRTKVIYKTSKNGKNIVDQRKIYITNLHITKNQESSGLNSPISENLNSPISENLNSTKNQESSGLNSPISENLNSPISENRKDNNINSNIIKNNNNSTSGNSNSDKVEVKEKVSTVEEIEKKLYKLLVDKLWPKWPEDRKGAMSQTVKNWKTLSVDEKKLALQNATRYLNLHGEFVHNINRYLKDKYFRDEYLNAVEERKAKEAKPKTRVDENKAIVESSIAKMQKIMDELDEQEKLEKQNTI